jgi:hypothetical protein
VPPERQRENQLPLEAYDDQSYLIKNPKDWINNFDTSKEHFNGIDA